MAEIKKNSIGVWFFTETMAADKAVEFAQKIEQLGYGTLWLPETLGRNPFAHSALLLAKTNTLQLATGIASIYHRDPMAAKQAANTLAEQSNNRFILGLGVSHKPMVQAVRGHEYASPVKTMRNYLTAMAAAPYTAVAPSEPVPTVIAALGPYMLKLAASATQGALPYFTTPEHTAMARATMGDDALLCVEQKLILETDPDKARKVARAATAMYIGLDNYRNNWLRLGFSEADLTDGGSDKFIDAVIAWGDVASLQQRVQAHFDAGADHVCIQPINPNGEFGAPDWALLEALSPSV